MLIGSNNSLQSSIADLKASKNFALKLPLLVVEIVWKFNPQAAQQFGGIGKRLVHFFKLSLYMIIASRTLTDEILCTVPCKIEANMNSRPLKKAPSDINDSLPLTSNHFLLGRSSVNLPSVVFIGDVREI